MYSSYDLSRYARGYGSSSSLYGSDDIFDAFFAAFAGFLGIVIFIAIVLVVLQIIGMWKVFTKAGEKGWKSIIPFYNVAILYKISGMSPYLVFLYLGLLVPIVNIFVAIAFSVIDLYQKINLMKGFNKSTGFTVAMIIVPFITYLVLGFGDSKYVGFGNNPVVENNSADSSN